ncbi:MAG: TonB-dependent receptor [Candidatus Cloacimonetes bacterium]|nr:TonB-dependent receptor [Candidatus Cloacimonadota bacterium]
MKKIGLIIILTVLLILPVYAQVGKIAGRVTIEDSGQPLANAAVILVDAEQGTYTKGNGTFTLTDVPVGIVEVQFRYMGYGTKTLEVEVIENETAIINVKLVVESIGIEGIKIVSDRAKERQTPVAFTDMDKEEMESKLGSRDIPLALITTPSVYATNQGGGAGDARVNVRGFDQRNVAIMINGVPVNDMENGWVYWSNWDGVGDATSSIQMQRGLSAVNLATPSIGGTMNIITDPTAMESGTKFKQEFGTGGFLKSTVMAGTGLIDNKFAISAVGVRKTGEGLIDKTWTDSWAYYLATGWNVSSNNKLELYVVGAPQRHGQNLYKQNIATYDQEYADDLDDYYSNVDTAYVKFPEQGYDFNQNWSPVSNYYDGKQFWNGEEHDRHDENFINERENFYHKPQVNLNWYTKLNEDFNIYSILYYSGGEGGGTGTYGSIFRRDANGELGDDDYKFYYGPSPWAWDWDETIAMNSGPAGDYWVDKDSLYKEDGEALGILRNSRNNQWTIGAISKAYFTINENFTTSVGIDWRTATIDHFREVRDLLGGDYYDPRSDEDNDLSDFWTIEEDFKRELGDKIDYYNTNSVDWIGGYWQGEYSLNALTAYLMGGYSTIKYSYEDHFSTADTLANGEPDIDSGELTTETDMLGGYQVKGGSSFIINDYLDIFGNVGMVSKCPIFDEVINDWTGEKFDNPKNEEFLAFEAGINFKGLDGKLATKANFYFTDRKNESQSFEHDTLEGDEIKIFVSGLDSRHLGFELEASYMPLYLLRFDASFAKGDWKYLNNVEDTPYDVPGGGIETIDIYVKDIKVGDAPQTQLSFGTSIFPLEGMKAQLIVQHYRDHYSAFNAFSRNDPDDTTQSWKIPDYTKLNFHLNYILPVKVNGLGVSVFAHMFNLLDTTFIQDATDNSEYNSWGDKEHNANNAEVYLGMPRTFNAGVSVTF